MNALSLQSRRHRGACFAAAPPSRRAFTLIELLVVILILAVLMAVALPLYLSAYQNSARKTARANLHTLITAEQAHRLHDPALSYTDDMAELAGPGKQLDHAPVGPGTTVYTLHTSGATPGWDGSRPIPNGGVAACAQDTSRGALGNYGCFIPTVDAE